MATVRTKMAMVRTKMAMARIPRAKKRTWKALDARGFLGRIWGEI